MSKVLATADFNRMCANIWGENFRPKAAKALGKGLRTIERYSAGKASVPAEVRRKLGMHTAMKAEEMAEDAATLLG